MDKAYRVKLSDFEGPLDLLLFFIKRDELDIYDIPIAKITKEFLEYLQYLTELNLDIAGEFIVTAAELMQIKAQMLLPRPEGENEEEFDPRAELVRRLLEYKRWKEMAEELERRQIQHRKIAYRGNFENDPKIIDETDGDDIIRDVTLFDLIAAFQFAVNKMPRKHVHEINKLNVSLDEQMLYIVGLFKEKKEISFFEIVMSMTEKIRIVVTFIAVLELMKQQIIAINQFNPYADITIVKVSEEAVIAPPDSTY
ncbi:MAG: segregation/condensation protein A [Bacteriovoracaceae bacterium]|nr:segregation/condensation protein A [Bacteroidota bacterium]